ncbi:MULTISPECIES: hypothetical protein [unclassified Streptomyces]|nr:MULTISPECIES: hypothetical protein [unclassified Streptomyces]
MSRTARAVRAALRAAHTCRETWDCSGCGVRTSGADYCGACYKPRPSY